MIKVAPSYDANYQIRQDQKRWEHEWAKSHGRKINIPGEREIHRATKRFSNEERGGYCGGDRNAQKYLEYLKELAE